MNTNTLIATTVALIIASSVAYPNSPSPETGEGVTEATRVHLDIPAGDLMDALKAFAKQTGTDLVYLPRQVTGLKTHGLKGEHTTRDAIEKLLEGTNLHASTDVATGAMLIASQRPTASLNEGEQSTRVIRLAQSEGAASAPSEPAADTQNQELQLSEIVVSAQKKDERLQDVPIPVTAISGDTLVASNQLRMQDYFTSVPGLNVQPGQNSAPVLSIRGITSGEANPTVGVMVDDVPYGSSTFVGGGSPAPDLDPSDLQRIEVLRGPQGTLYGASSIGGLIKFVTIDPSTDAFSGRLQAGLSGVEHSGQTGYNVRGAANVPLSEAAALRVSGYTRKDPGYIDDPVLDLKDVNTLDSYGGRISALYRFSPDFTAKVAATIQHSERDGSPTGDRQPGLGDLQQSDPFDTGSYDRTMSAFSATLNGTVGEAQLTSLTGYNINKSDDSLDFSPILGGAAEQFFDVSGSALLSHIHDKKLTQELRLTVPLSSRFDLLAGAFYAHEDATYAQSLTAQDFETGEVVGGFGDYLFDSELTEYAAFADLTVHVTDRFDIQFGGRQSHIKQNIVQSLNEVSNPRINSKEDSFTYLVTPQLRLSSSLMIYARLASGYRPGGPNYNSPALGLPSTYDPDKTQNYEIGAKGDLANGLLSFDASVYRIEWRDIQLALFDSDAAAGYTANGSKARSEGVELSLEARPVRGLRIGAWGAWNDAKLTEVFPPQSSVVGLVGYRLPNATRFSGTLTVDEEFPIGAALTGFLGAQLSHVGDRKGYFVGPGLVRQDFPSFSQLNLRAGIGSGDWKAELFASNVTDKRGVLAGGTGTLTPAAFSYITPRTIGLNVSKQF